jgi:hypothetical protein
LSLQLANVDDDANLPGVVRIERPMRVNAEQLATALRAFARPKARLATGLLPFSVWLLLARAFIALAVYLWPNLGPIFNVNVGSPTKADLDAMDAWETAGVI